MERVAPKAPKPKEVAANVAAFFDTCEVDGDNCGEDESDDDNDYDPNDPSMKRWDESESQSVEASQASNG